MVLICGCGKEFINNRYPGGPNKHGRRQKHCSDKCTHKATNVRFYGLTLGEYYDMLHTQDFKCAICQKRADDEVRLLSVDHEHVEGFDRMPPEERKKYIRGLLCIPCNRYRLANTDLTIAKRVLSYLQAHEDRRFYATTIR